MAAVVFTTKAQWTTFHDAICADLGIPRPGKRQSDGVVQKYAQWTTSAFAPEVCTVKVNGVDRRIGILRGVPAAVVTRYGLSTLTNPSLNDDGTWNVTYNGKQYVVTLDEDEVSFPFRQAKPTSWTDPDTGATYDTSDVAGI